MKATIRTFARALTLGTIAASGMIAPASASFRDAGAANADAEGGVAISTPDNEQFRLAGDIAARFFPDGQMDTLIGEQLDSALSPAILARQFVQLNLTKSGLPAPTSDTSDAAYLSAVRVLDPAFDARTTKLMSAIRQNAVTAIVPMLPLVRVAYANALASRFSTEQLREIATFYATPTGSALARQMMSMNRDPAMRDVMLQMQRRMVDQMNRGGNAMFNIMNQGLPAPKGYADVTAEQKAQFLRILAIKAPAQ